METAAGCETKFFTCLVGQSCRSALNSWAAQQRRPTEDVEIFVPHPYAADDGELNSCLAPWTAFFPRQTGDL
jgi:hypothetical protein